MRNVFLSYAQSDAKWARELASLLKSRGLSVWNDAEIAPGQNWWKETGKALSNADAMVVLLSPDAVKSNNVQREIDFALSQPRFKNRLIPVVMRPTRDIPWILEELQMIVATPRGRPAAYRQVAQQLLATVE